MRTLKLILSVIVPLLIFGVVDVYGDTRMKNAFEIKSWDESPFLELDNGAKYSRAKLVKQYSGTINGEGQLEYLMAYNESGTAYFTGIEHFEGDVDNKIGAFSIMHEGTFADGSVQSTFKIIDGSQTKELIGLTGDGSYKTGHSMLVNFDFNYSIAGH